MRDPILREIRRIRAQRCIELARGVREAMEDTHRRVMAMATDIEWTAPNKYRAKFSLPTETEGKPRR